MNPQELNLLKDKIRDLFRIDVESHNLLLRCFMRVDVYGFTKDVEIPPTLHPEAVTKLALWSGLQAWKFSGLEAKGLELSFYLKNYIPEIKVSNSRTTIELWYHYEFANWSTL